MPRGALPEPYRRLKLSLASINAFMVASADGACARAPADNAIEMAAIPPNSQCLMRIFSSVDEVCFGPIMP